MSQRDLQLKRQRSGSDSSFWNWGSFFSTIVWPFSAAQHVVATQAANINLKIWPIQTHHEAGAFPEKILGIVNIDDNSVGLALSGGGARAHVLSAGYLRAIRDLGLSNEFSYISAVSGSSWAASIYTFAKDDDVMLLGESLKPEDCNLETLEKNNPGTLTTAVEKFRETLYQISSYIWKRLRKSKWWQRFIGVGILKEFDLDDKIMCLNEKHAESIIKANSDSPLITKYKNKFVWPKENRPFLIINACLTGPVEHNSGLGNSLQFTPLYSGVPFYRGNKLMTYKTVTTEKIVAGYLTSLFVAKSPSKKDPKSEITVAVGGGVIETFAYGTKQLKAPDMYFGSDCGNGVLGYANELFMLEDAVGASSAAHARAFQDISADEFVPSAFYFPVLSKDQEEFSKPWDHDFDFCYGDGGNYENTGLIPLLQRGLKKCICFINTAEEIDLDFVPGNYKHSKKAEDFVADTQLLCLFGLVDTSDASYNYTSNQIFDTKEVDNVLLDLIKSIKDGNGGICKSKLTLVDNLDWNISGGREVEILFIYNEHCRKFEDLLPPPTKAAVLHTHGDYGTFPHYKTIGQNGYIAPFSLDRKETNVLSAQAEFVIKNSADMFKSMFSKE